MYENNKGWVKIHRSITDTEIWDSDEPFDKRSAWVQLIMMANTERKKFVTSRGETIIVNRGQLFTSVRSLSNLFHWSKGKVERYTKMLENLKMVTLKRTKNGTLVTIVNYGLYQDRWDTNGDTNRDTNEDTSEDTNRDRLKKKRSIRSKEEKKGGASTVRPTGGSSSFLDENGQYVAPDGRIYQ